MSDFSRSDLSNVERALDRILSATNDGNGVNAKLSRMSDLLEKVVSRLDDISKKLDKR